MKCCPHEFLNLRWHGNAYANWADSAKCGLKQAIYVDKQEGKSVLMTQVEGAEDSDTDIIPNIHEYLTAELAMARALATPDAKEVLVEGSGTNVTGRCSSARASRSLRSESRSASSLATVAWRPLRGHGSIRSA